MQDLERVKIGRMKSAAQVAIHEEEEGVKMY